MRIRIIEPGFYDELYGDVDPGRLFIVTEQEGQRMIAAGQGVEEAEPMPELPASV